SDLWFSPPLKPALFSYYVISPPTCAYPFRRPGRGRHHQFGEGWQRCARQRWAGWRSGAGQFIAIQELTRCEANYPCTSPGAAEPERGRQSDRDPSVAPSAKHWCALLTPDYFASLAG